MVRRGGEGKPGNIILSNARVKGGIYNGANWQITSWAKGKIFLTAAILSPRDIEECQSVT